MLVICNGAPKSGSTWLYNILIRLGDYRWPPDRYLTKSSLESKANPTIRPDLLKEFLETEDLGNIDWISKNHLAEPEHRALLQDYEAVFIFDLERDIRDVIVSAYYDSLNRNQFQGTFPSYYWSEGRRLAHHILQYHDLWRGFGPRAYLSSYERLKLDFAGEVRRIAAVLHRELDDAQVLQIQSETSLEGLRDQYSEIELYEGDRFFRKGEIGDWVNHFDEKMSADLERIGVGGIPKIDLRALMERARSTFLSKNS